MAEFSMQWTTPAEQEQFDRMFEALSKYARYIDNTMDRAVPSTRWNDFGLTLAWESHRLAFPALPKFRVMPEYVGESNQAPPKTGVYVSLDDPDATLQFAWNGNARGKLLPGRHSTIWVKRLSQASGERSCGPMAKRCFVLYSTIYLVQI